VGSSSEGFEEFLSGLGMVGAEKRGRFLSVPGVYPSFCCHFAMS
jgi:hypothetical protein